LGNVKLQRGATLRDCKLAYKTFGTLSHRKDNVIVYPTLSGQHYDNEWPVADGRALDPKKYLIIIPNMFGNGLSSSPSNAPEPGVLGRVFFLRKDPNNLLTMLWIW
jgi:homoserine O-acetyltransferase/O-succinyltransferase